jgi:hypothetical protein
MPGFLARSGLDNDVDAPVVERLDDVRDQRHAALSRSGLFGDPDLQSRESLTNRDRSMFRTWSR